MKVYYVGSNYDGCYYVRCLLPQRENGWDGQIKSFLIQPDSPETMFRKSMDADVIVFHRPDQKAKVEAIKLLKEAGKKIVVDNDDTYVPDSGADVPTFGRKKEILDAINENLNEAYKLADLVTASTDFLADEFRKLNPNVVTLKNCIDPEDWSEPKRNEGDKIRVGLIGSVTTADYKEIKKVLKYLSDNPKYQLVVFGLPPKGDDTKILQDVMKEHIEFWEGLNIEWQPLVNIQEYKYVLNELKLDIALIPRTNNYFNKCKSNLKYLELSMCEVPCIVSSFKDSPYENDKVIKCETEDEWFDALKTLGDKESRRKLGIIAKEHVLKEYNIQDKATLWEQTYKQICEK